MHRGDDVAVVEKAALFSSLPEPWPRDLIPQIQASLRETKQKVFVLDDDPTGTQTVHDTIVLTEWSVAALIRELESADPVCYIPTNSRGVNAAKAVALNLGDCAELARSLRADRATLQHNQSQRFHLARAFPGGDRRAGRGG